MMPVEMPAHTLQVVPTITNSTSATTSPHSAPMALPVYQQLSMQFNINSATPQVQLAPAPVGITVDSSAMDSADSRADSLLESRLIV